MDRRKAGYLGRHSTTAGVVTPPPPEAPNDQQHASARVLCDPRPAQHSTGRVKHRGVRKRKLRGPSSPWSLKQRTVALHLPEGQGCTLAGTGGSAQRLHDWAASRSLALGQQTINTPQLSSLSCWRWSCNL